MKTELATVKTIVNTVKVELTEEEANSIVTILGTFQNTIRAMIKGNAGATEKEFDAMWAHQHEFYSQLSDILEKIEENK